MKSLVTKTKGFQNCFPDFLILGQSGLSFSPSLCTSHLLLFLLFLSLSFLLFFWCNLHIGVTSLVAQTDFVILGQSGLSFSPSLPTSHLLLFLLFLSLSSLLFFWCNLHIVSTQILNVQLNTFLHRCIYTPINLTHNRLFLSFQQCPSAAS